MRQKLKALGFFKDWTNYLLVTTVGALGWTSARDGATFSSPWQRTVCIWSFALSIVFAILTLALIPHVAEELTEEHLSIYSVQWKGRLIPFHCTLTRFCMPQHVFFLVGILVYAVGAWLAS